MTAETDYGLDTNLWELEDAKEGEHARKKRNGSWGYSNPVVDRD